jgi:hypothetical protein
MYRDMHGIVNRLRNINTGKSYELTTRSEIIEECMRLADEIERDLQRHYIALPLDGNGEPVRVGDVMETRRDSKQLPNYRFEVHAIHYHDYGEGCSLTEASCSTVHYHPSECVHYHEPTIEDMLREFYVHAVRGKEAHAEDVDEDVIAEYAKKLQLKGGEDEG